MAAFPRAEAVDWEHSVTTLFVPEVLTPAQYFAASSEDSEIEGVRRLMRAVLEDALHCFQDNISARSPMRRRLYYEAERWITSTDTVGLFSFHNVCETLGVEPEKFRQGLLKWRARHKAGIEQRRLQRRSPVLRVGRISTPQRRTRRKTARPEEHALAQEC